MQQARDCSRVSKFAQLSDRGYARSGLAARQHLDEEGNVAAPRRTTRRETGWERGLVVGTHYEEVW
jgi:hypothetical protein